MSKKMLIVNALAPLLTFLLVAVPFAQPGRKVSGVVVEAASGRPVANAQVEYQEAGTVQQTTTDTKGYFELANGSRGVVTVTAHDFGTAHRRWPPRTGSQLRIALAPPATVSGTVGDMATGRLVPARVTITVRHPGNVLSDVAFAENGVFRFDDLPPGPAVVLARSDGYAPYAGVLQVDAKAPTNARIRLLLQAVAVGQVVDSRGAAAVGALVSAEYVALDGGEMLAGLVGGRSVTGADGDFALDALVPDTPIVLHAEFAGSRSDAVTVTVPPGTMQTGIVLRLRH